MEMTVPKRFQGAPNRGQGGYSAGLLHEGHPTRAWFRSPVPLDVPMIVERDGPVRRVFDGDTLVMETHPAVITGDPLPPVTMEQAVAGRAAAEAMDLPDRITTCYSCGGAGSLGVHAGPVPGGQVWATPVTYPDWTASSHLVDREHLWAPVDCAAGYAVAFGGADRTPFTGWLTVDVHRGIEPGRGAVVVALAAPEWDGRKRAARSAMYTEDGELVVTSESLWIATT